MTRRRRLKQEGDKEQEAPENEPSSYPEYGDNYEDEDLRQVIRDIEALYQSDVAKFLEEVRELKRQISVKDEKIENQKSNMKNHDEKLKALKGEMSQNTKTMEDLVSSNTKEKQLLIEKIEKRDDELKDLVNIKKKMGKDVEEFKKQISDKDIRINNQRANMRGLERKLKTMENHKTVMTQEAEKSNKLIKALTLKSQQNMDIKNNPTYQNTLKCVEYERKRNAQLEKNLKTSMENYETLKVKYISAQTKLTPARPKFKVGDACLWTKNGIKHKGIVKNMGPMGFRNEIYAGVDFGKTINGMSGIFYLKVEELERGNVENDENIAELLNQIEMKEDENETIK